MESKELNENVNISKDEAALAEERLDKFAGDIVVKKTREKRLPVFREPFHVVARIGIEPVILP